MKDSLVKSIADAVLYEGYLLYPYRPSAVKNQQRWNFGALCPESYSHAQSGTESWTMRTQVLIESDPNTKLNVEVRFLHLSNREVAKLIGDCKLQIAECGHLQIPSIGTAHFAVVPTLEVDGKLFQPLQEAVEREVSSEVDKLDAASGMSASNLQNGSEATAFNQQGTQGKLNSVASRGMSASNLQNGSEATAFNQPGTQGKLNSVASLPFCNPAEETWEPLLNDS